MRDAATYSETKRKIEHIVPLGFAFTLTIFPKWLVFTLSVTAVVYGIFLSRLLVKGTWRDEEMRKGFSTGKAAYGIMVLILLLIFHKKMQIAAGAWAVMALGDGAASIIGIRYGKTKLPWNKDKSWMGMLAFTLAGFAACAGLLYYTQATGDASTTIGSAFALLSAKRLMAMALITSAVCAAVESLPLPVNDNISIPALAGLLLYLLGG